MDKLRVNRGRLTKSIEEMAAIGATEGGGVTRLALSDEDKAGRDLLSSWMIDAGLEVLIDDFGNMTGVRTGQSNAPPVVLASHIDTVEKGGRFDGALGVLSGLEVIRTLNDAHITTDVPIALVNWTNEEGARFEPAMMGSGAAIGVFDKDYINGRTDRDGKRFGDELDRIGYRGRAKHRPLPAAAYLEVHVEQGPVLEAADQPVGIVGGIVGITWIEVTINGQSDHAGPSPMRLRHDPLAAAAELILGVERIATTAGDVAVGTVGRINVEPNGINTIPGKVVFSVDFRHPELNVLNALVARLEALTARVCEERGVSATVNRFWTSEPTPFDPKVISTIRDAAQKLAVKSAELWSGAGHDAKYAADVCPSGMIFVRSQGGLSHCEEEFTTPEDIEAGANILLGATLRLARAIY